MGRRKLAYMVKKVHKNSITSTTEKNLHITHIIYNTSIYTSKSNTFIKRSQYPTYSFKIHNIHHMHTQNKIRRQDHKSKVNTCKHRHLVVPRITTSQASSRDVPRIAADRASSGAVEEVVDEVIYRIVRSHL
jgi:hypothetical protein